MHESQGDWTGPKGRQARLDALRWVVGFVHLEVDALRAGDWLNLREDLAAFLQAGEGPHVWEAAEVRAAQEALRDLLAGKVVAVPSLRLAWSGWRTPCRVDGPLAARVLWRVRTLLDTGVASTLRHCPMCQTLFVRRHKQVYCARPCANRASQQTFRRAHQWTA
jgi:hypothetical protein